MDPLHPDNLRMDPKDRPKTRRPKKPPRHLANQWFLKGPIPGEWIRRAIKHAAGARAMLVLWYLAGRGKSREVVPTHAEWTRFGLSRRVGNRGISDLEQAGLVKVKRHRGRCPVVTLLDVSEEVEP